MSSIGSVAVTAAVTAATKGLAFTGKPWQRQAMNLTLTGHGVAAASLTLLLYRLGTLVAQCQAFSGSSSSATGTVDLNTVPLETVFTAVARGVVRTLTGVLWNTATGNLLAQGDIPIRAFGDTYEEESGATALPALGGYAYNSTTGLWYPVALVGTGDQMQIEIDEDGGVANP